MSAMRTLVIPGGSGFLGRAVSAWFATKGWRVVVISRSSARRRNTLGSVEHVPWNGRTLDAWVDAVDGADVVLNLAGRSVNCRYHARNRAEILGSRTQTTHIIGEAIARVKMPPRVWLNSSTATIYRHAEDRPQGDEYGEIGSGFSVEVAKAWERAFFEAQVPATVRRVALRTAMVMGPGAGGPFNVFYTLARFGLGGAMGPGTQRVSWVHVDDFCRAIDFLIEREDVTGTINISAPNAPTNAEFTRDLRRAVGRKIGLPAYRWMLEVGAIFLRTETELPLKSRWVAPTRLQSLAFNFSYRTWSEAARDLVAKSRPLVIQRSAATKDLH